MPLQNLAEEDPTFRTYTDDETGQTIIAGMGELHLEIIVDRLLREFKVEANVGNPQVSYRETIKQARYMLTINMLVSRVVKVSTDMLSWIWSLFRLEKVMYSRTRLSAVLFLRNIFLLLTQVFRGAMQTGVLAGYPVVDVKCTLVDGSYHEVDSSEMAFKIAGSMAFKDGCKKG